MSFTISGLIGLIVTQVLGDTVPYEKIANFIEVGGLIIFALIAWFGRVRQGDITWYGKKLK